MAAQVREHPSLASVVFNSAGYRDLGTQDGKRVWHTPQGDGLWLFFFPIPPDLPKDARSEEELREMFSKLLARNSFVELRLLAVDGQPSVQIIIKVPQQPSGMTYVGSIIIPFRDFSFVVRVQCQEHGTTGMREVVILNSVWAKGDVAADSSGRPVGFSPDDSEYDAQFPDHPLSRVRSVLRHIEESVRLDAAVKMLPPFGLPQWPVE